MIFAELPSEEAEGALLAHSVKLPKASFKKGRRLSAEDVAALLAAGRRTVIAARLEPGDVGEDEAAARIAAAACGPGLVASAPFTGRCNLLASGPGLLVVDRERLDRLNLVDEAVTIASLPPYDVLEPRQMAATVKIIPFAAPRAAVERCAAIAAEGGPLLRLAAFRPRRVGLIQTTLPGLKPSILDKTVEAIDGRVVPLGCPPVTERRCPHEAGAVAAAIEAMRRDGAALILVAGASAITDRRDVIPAALEQAGGTVEHLGMPVDPGNLLMLGRLGGEPVLGLPGCVRSPKVNGFDWVLQRLVADLPVGRRDIMLMGVGGLLKEIPSRPQPRAEGAAPALRAPRAPTIAALVLAAGRSSRMGASNKLLAEVAGKPMVAHAVDAALASQARPVVVVVGNEAARVRAALGDRPVGIVENPDFAAGISGSLKAGLRALGDAVDGALVCLGDMPLLSAAALDRLIAAYNPVEGRAICVPTWNGKRGNPVLWSRRFFGELMAVDGDIGGRHLIDHHSEAVVEVPVDGNGVFLDIDTPQTLQLVQQAGEVQAPPLSPRLPSRSPS